MTFEEAYAYIEAAMKEIYDKYGVELSDTFDDAVDSLDEASKNLFKSVRTTSSLAEAFKSLQNVIEKIPEEFRTRVLAAINAIFGNDSLSNQAKAIILSDINALFTNTELRTETKTRVVEAIAHLVGNSNDARSAVDLFEEYISVALQNAKNPEDAINELVDNILKSGDKFGHIDTILANVHTETGKLLAIAKMRLNSAEWYTAGADRRQQLHNENVQLGTAMGWNFESSTGNWLDENGNVAYTVSSGGLNSADSFYNSLIDAISKITVNVDTKVTANGNTSTSTTTTSASTSSSPPSSSSSGNQSSGGGTSSSSNTSTSAKPKTYNNISATGGTYVYDNWGGKVWLTASDVAKINSYAPGTPGEIALSGGAYASISSNGTVSVRKGTFYGTYDYGGILHGLGGIKDTTEDEMVLPPRMTKSLIEAETSGAFNALLDHLGIVTAAANNIAGFGGGVPNNSVGEQYNGDSYNFGNISLTESQAKSMTVYDLAQMSRNLGLTS